jgi:cell division protein FtsN
MEQQKVLWIIFSVTLFLLVVVVVGFVWFLPPADEPSGDERPIAGGGDSATMLDPIEWVRDDVEVPGISEATDDSDRETEEEGDLLLVYGEADEPDTGAQSGQSAEEKETDGAGIQVVETPPETQRPATTPAEPKTAAPAPSGTAAKPSAAAPVSPRPAASQPKPAAAAPPPADTRPKTVRVTQFWIQAGSFRSQSRAEESRDSLAAKGWESRIVTREVGGELYYRIRLGPYDSEAEAEKFLGWLRDLDSFKTSYISQVYTTRTVN